MWCRHRKGKHHSASMRKNKNVLHKRLWKIKNEETQKKSNINIHIISSVCCMSLFPDVVIPESPEAYIKLTVNTLKSSSGRKLQPPGATAWDRRACPKLQLKHAFLFLLTEFYYHTRKHHSGCMSHCPEKSLHILNAKMTSLHAEVQITKC